MKIVLHCFVMFSQKGKTLQLGLLEFLSSYKVFCDAMMPILKYSEFWASFEFKGTDTEEE